MAYLSHISWTSFSLYKNIYYISKIVTFLYKKFSIYVTIAELPPLDRYRKGVNPTWKHLHHFYFLLWQV